MKRTRLRAVSKKRAAENRVRRRNLHDRYGDHPRCHAGPVLLTVGVGVCRGQAVDGHELVMRSSGGSVTDPDNVIPVCRPCHRWITEHPGVAERVGLVQRRRL